MKLELKAYKCVFQKLFSHAYNMYMWQDDKQFELIYGKNQKDAVKNKCSNDEFESYWDLKKNIQTRRCSEFDLYSQEKSILLVDLPDNLIKHLTHSLGVKIGDAKPESFYRNYSFYSSKNSNCEKLCALGLMEMWRKNESYVYSVTTTGKEAVATLLLVLKPTT